MELRFPRLRCLIEEEVACERGSNLLEVVLTVSLVGLAAVAGMERMANQVDRAFLHISENLASIFDSSNFGTGDPSDGGPSTGTSSATGNLGGGTPAGNPAGGGSGKNPGGGAAGGLGSGPAGGGGNQHNGNCNKKDNKGNCGSDSGDGGSDGSDGS